MMCSYSNKLFFKILNQQKLELTQCKYILIRQDPPFNLEYISTTYILDKIKNKVKIQEGMILSNEPGYYKKGSYGIRIENLVFVKQIKKKIFFRNRK